MMAETTEFTFKDKLVRILGGGALGTAIILGYILASVGFVLGLLYLIKLLHQAIVGV